MTHAAPASVGRRAAARLIDTTASALCGGGLLLWVALGAVSSMGADPATVDATGMPSGRQVVLAGAALVALTLVQWWTQAAHGWTLGKRALGLRTVDARTGRPVGAGRILGRGLVLAAGTLVLVVGRLVVLASPLLDGSGRHRGWHDRAVGAEVVDLRTGTMPQPRPAGQRPPRPRARAVEVEDAPVTVTVVPTGAIRSALAASRSAAAEGGEGTAPDPWVALGLPTGGTGPDARAQVEATDDAHAAAGRRLDALLKDAGTRRDRRPAYRPATVELVLPPLAEPGVAPDVDTRAMAVVPVPVFALDPALEQTRRSPWRPGEEPGGEPVEVADVDPTTADLELSDGRIVTVERSLLVGRNPSGSESAQLLRVADTGRSVSKTHLQIGVDPAGVWVTDRASTNGTLVTLADGQQIVCGAGQRVRVPIGATVSFGDYGLRVVRAPQRSPRA